jgi:hypothetical protein
VAHLYAFANLGIDDPYAEAPTAWLYGLANLGVAYDPTDAAGGSDGHVRDFDRFLFAFINVAVSGSGNRADLYAFALIDTTTPTPHLWYVTPAFGEIGWQFKVIGYGLGDTQAALSGLLKLNAIACSVITWQLVAAEALPHTIDKTTDTADPVHQEIVAVVPAGAVSGVLTVETDGP